jgi:hypothetical protein
MVRDHGAYEIIVADGYLIPGAENKAESEKNARCDQADAKVFLLIHRTHDQKFDTDHRGGHAAGHPDLINAQVEIAKGIHHRIHQKVHRDERDERHYSEFYPHISSSYMFSDAL